MPLPTISRGGVMFSGNPSVHLSVCPSVRQHISRDAISLYLVEGLQWNLPQIFVVWVGIAEKSFQGHRSQVKVMSRPIIL